MTPTTAPDEGMFVLVPVGGCLFDGLRDLGPGLEAAAFQRQGAQDLPPGLDQVQVGRVLGLEDELPARMEQAEQQHVRRTVGIEVVDDGIDALARRIDPGLDRAQEIDPVGRRAVLIGLGEGVAAGRLEGAENIAGDTAAAVIDLLPGSFGLGTRRPDELPAGMAPGLLRSHLVQADDYTACWRRRVELFDRPLIWALKSSVTSSPDALSRCKRVVDRSWVCPRLSPLAPMRSTTPHHLISGRERVPDQHPACTGTGSEAGGTSLLSGMVEPGGGMRSRAHLGHPRAAGLCADDRAIRLGPHGSLGRHEAGLYVSPDRDQQLTSEGDDGDTLDAPGGGADAIAIPARQRALGLMTQPQPGELDERLARAPVAGLADALLTARAAAGIGTGCQARIGRQVAAGGEVAVEDLRLQHGCELRADAFQPQQRRELGAALLARLRRARVAHGLDLGQVPQHELKAVELPADLRREPARQRAAVPGHEPGQTFAAIRPERLVVVDPLRRAQALDPVAEPQALLEQRPALAAEAALVLVLRRGRTHHGADLPLAAQPGHQGPQQRLRIQPIGLCAPGTAVDLQRGRVH